MAQGMQTEEDSDCAVWSILSVSNSVWCLEFMIQRKMTLFGKFLVKRRIWKISRRNHFKSQKNKFKSLSKE